MNLLSRSSRLRDPRSSALLLLATLIVVAPGCPWGFIPQEPWDEPEPIDNTHPTIVEIDIPHWPPLGPDDEIVVLLEDEEEGLTLVTFEFRNTVSVEISGGSATVAVTGRQLGEGFGPLLISVEDEQGWRSTRFVEGLLVDLTPPRAMIGATVLRADGVGDNGALRAWIGDAWIVGSAQLRFQGEILVHALPEGRPPTLGKAWDWSLVTFPATELPVGAGPAVLYVLDAAGNELIEEFELVVDDTPPQARILSPGSGATVGGRFLVVIEALDEGDGPVWIELYAGGALVATAAGPIAEILLDADELPLGEIELVAYAFDLAGHDSVAAPVTITVE